MWEKLTSGILQVLTERGPLLVNPPFGARLRLLWAFRNFSILPQQVLSAGQNRLIDALCSNGRHLPRSPRGGERDALIGTVISAAVPAAPHVHERRQQARCGVEFEVRYGLRSAGFAGKGLDLSAGGIGFSGPKTFGPGTEVQIEYRLHPTDAWTRARALVRHADEDRMGAQILELRESR